MKELTQWITAHPEVSTWITIISVFGVIVSLIALILQIKDKKKRAVYYNIASTVLIDNKVSAIEGIKILFQNKEITTVSVSNIKLWNGGNEFLEKSDFYPGCPLKIVVPENEKILAIALTEQSDETCKINARISDENMSEATISFYCLEPRQGGTINVYHTNTADDGLKIVGKIKGGRVINKSVDVDIENGEMSMSIGKYKVYFDGGLFAAGRDIFDLLYHTFGISVVKGKRK